MRGVARVLRSAVRIYDVVGRYGGEEFLVVLPDADEGDSIETAQRIRSAIAALAWPLRPVTISTGWPRSRPRRLIRTMLVAEADQALYESKRNGRDCVTHFHELQTTTCDDSLSRGIEDSALRIVRCPRSAEHRDAQLVFSR